MPQTVVAGLTDLFGTGTGTFDPLTVGEPFSSLTPPGSRNAYQPYQFQEFTPKPPNAGQLGSQESQYFSSYLQNPMFAPFMQNIAAESEGQVPTDVMNLIQQQAAEGGIGTIGAANAPLTQNNLLRTLGLTSLQMQQQGQENLQGLLGTAPKLSPESLFVSPTAQAQINAQQQLEQARNLAENQRLQAQLEERWAEAGLRFGDMGGGGITTPRVYGGGGGTPPTRTTTGGGNPEYAALLASLGQQSPFGTSRTPWPEFQNLNLSDEEDWWDALSAGSTPGTTDYGDWYDPYTGYYPGAGDLAGGGGGLDLGALGGYDPYSGWYFTAEGDLYDPELA